MATGARRLGLASYSGRPWLSSRSAAKMTVDAAQAARLSISQWADHHAFCIWCLLAAGATFAAVPLALPEASKAVRILRRRLNPRS